ncbi:ComF family protein [Leifsonia lichenia]
MTITNQFRESILDAAAVLHPVQCSGCGAHDRAVCPACALALRPGALAAEGADPPLLAALSYESVARRVLLAFKDGGRTDAAPALAGALRAAIVEAQSHAQAAGRPRPHPQVDARHALLPVVIPSTRAAFRRRGYHPTALLLRRARILVPPLWRALRLTRQTEDQAGLTAQQRTSNRAGSIVASPRLRGRDCLIVDDIVTTGSTVREAARAITAVGGRVVFAVAVARTPLRGGSPGIA